MPTELVYIALDDARLTALAQASEATGFTKRNLISVFDDVIRPLPTDKWK
jgi:hypothetical protein